MFEMTLLEKFFLIFGTSIILFPIVSIILSVIRTLNQERRTEILLRKILNRSNSVSLSNSKYEVESGEGFSDS